MDPISLIAAATSIAKSTGLGTWLGKKLGGEKGSQVAGKIVDIAMAASGAKTPEEAAELALADANLARDIQLKILDQSARITELEFADISNARAMQVAALGQEDNFSKRFVYWFAAFWSLFACAYIGFITFGEIPANNVRFADTILGFVLGTLIATIIQFFYGSSRSSSGKTEVMASLLNKAADK